jgi:hypothetical protein
MVVVGLLVLALLVELPLIKRTRNATVLAEADLGDGRILRVKAVTFGKVHEIGYEAGPTRYLSQWLPSSILQLFQRNRRAAFYLYREGLVVWVDAISSVSGTQVDCQATVVELLDNQGNAFRKDYPRLFTAGRYPLEGHAFYSFPRDTKTLTLRAKGRGEDYVQMTILNFGPQEAAATVNHD